MQVKSIAKCSKGILQYFQPLLSYHLSLISLFYLFLRGRFTQVLLYNSNDVEYVSVLIMCILNDNLLANYILCSCIFEFI